MIYSSPLALLNDISALFFCVSDAMFLRFRPVCFFPCRHYLCTTYITQNVHKQFRSKPGPLSRRLPWVSPYHRRLDWCLWIAALGHRRFSRWFPRFLLKLVDNDREVRQTLLFLKMGADLVLKFLCFAAKRDMIEDAAKNIVGRWQGRSTYLRRAW